MASSVPAGRPALDELLRTDGVHSVFQPIVELDTGLVVAHQALARGPRGQEVAVGASVGVAVYPADGEDFEALLHAADLGMYAQESHARAGR